jgi:hypothetical protein
LTPGDRRLLALKAECEEVSGELGRMLEAVRANKYDFKWSGIVASRRNMRNIDGFAALQSRLDMYREEVLGVLREMMRYVHWLSPNLITPSGD